MQHQKDIQVSPELPSYGHVVESAVDYSKTHYKDIAQSMSSADVAIRAFVAERPFVAVGMAVAVGYIVARTINGIR